LKKLKSVFLDTVPVLTGYICLGIGFGILLSQQAGRGVAWSALMGIFLYAGSCQYMLVDMLVQGASVISVALATLLLNARHIFYGISLVDAYSGSGKKKFYLIFGLTDETYSLVTQKMPPEGMSYHRYCFWVTLLDHLYWITGCVLGSLVGHLLPISFEGVEFVLTALFVTLLVEQLLSQKNPLPAIIGLTSTALCLLLFGKQVFLIPAMVLIALVLAVSFPLERRQKHA